MDVILRLRQILCLKISRCRGDCCDNKMLLRHYSALTDQNNADEDDR